MVGIKKWMQGGGIAHRWWRERLKLSEFVMMNFQDARIIFVASTERVSLSSTFKQSC